MDAFENVVAFLLQRQGYWVWTSFKVELTKAEKRSVGKPSRPRQEIDILAFKPTANKILAIECKSLLNSRGVRAGSVLGKDRKGAKKYKLFTDPPLRNKVFSRLVKQLAHKKIGACRASTKVQLCLAAGKIASKEDQAIIQKHFDKKGWRLFDETWFAEQFAQLADSAYENDVAAVVAKLLLRNSKQKSQAVKA